MKEILEILISWPTATILVVVMLRGPLTQLIERIARSDSVKAQLGPATIKLGQLVEEGDRAVKKLGRLQVLMAETRLLELEITENHFGGRFSPDHRHQMKKQIEELRRLTDKGNA